MLALGGGARHVTQAPAPSLGNEARERTGPPMIPLIDPTANVLALVAAETKRQDDLREAQAKFQTLEIKRIDDLRIATERYHELEVRRQDDLRNMLDHCQEEISLVREAGNAALAIAETKRIDALLQAARAELATSSEKAAAIAATLAQQVATTADASRVSVAALASQIADTNAQTQQGVDRRLTALEQSQYSIGGRDVQRDEGKKENASQMQLLFAAGGAILYAAAQYLSR